MKKNKMLYRIVAAVLACAVVALALVTYQSRSSSNAPVAEGAVTATGSAKGMEAMWWWKSQQMPLLYTPSP